MEFMGYVGWTSYWDCVYYMSEPVVGSRLMKHELKHVEQMGREGKLVFTVKYLWYAATVGYWDNPYEVEARAAENV